MQGALGDTIGLLPSAIWTVVKVAFKAAKDDDVDDDDGDSQLFAFPHLSFISFVAIAGHYYYFLQQLGPLLLRHQSIRRPTHT